MINKDWKYYLQKTGIVVASSALALGLIISPATTNIAMADGTSSPSGNNAGGDSGNNSGNNSGSSSGSHKKEESKDVEPTPTEEPKKDINYANLTNRDPDVTINNTDRQSAYTLIIDYMNSLKALYDLSDAAEKRMDEVFYQANVYIANSRMTVAQLIAYIETVKTNLATAAGSPSIPGETSSFLFLVNDIPSGSIRYGQTANLNLSLANLSKESVTDVVVTPKISTKISEWPFVISNASDVRMISSISAGANVEDAKAKKQDLSWSYTVSKDAKTGIYPLTFHVQYYINGKIEETDLVTYVGITGKSENGTLEDEPTQTKSSTPRIIVTGFTTDPGEVFGGDTFNLTITVQNTSSVTAVSNIQFDLEAAQTGKDTNNTYEAFLPTSGSATIYVDNIPAGESKDISIEMTARSDLAQKPYVITVNAAYEDKDHNAYEASTNVSIPVKQNARIDIGAIEISPESVAVGNQTNVMFSIYNMGKTTLYNVQVKFDGETVTSDNTFIGKIEPDGTGNVDMMVTGVAPTMDDGTVTAVITYEDESGNAETIEKEMNIYVFEEMYDDMGDYPMDDFDMGDGDGEPKSKGALIGGIAGGVVAIIVAIIIIVNVAKKKKRAALQREIDELDED